MFESDRHLVSCLGRYTQPTFYRAAPDFLSVIISRVGKRVKPTLYCTSVFLDVLRSLEANEFITLHEGRVKKCIEFLIFFVGSCLRNLVPRLISLLMSSLSSHTKVVHVTDYRGENWMYV